MEGCGPNWERSRGETQAGERCTKKLDFNFFQSKAEEIMEDSIEGQRLRFLENEIHKTNLKLMEGKEAITRAV